MDVCLLGILCILSGRGFCDELITRPEESYRLWYIVVCDLKISLMRKRWSTGSCRAKKKTGSLHFYFVPVTHPALYSSVSQLPGRGPVPDPGINYTGLREVLLEFVILVF